MGFLTSQCRSRVAWLGLIALAEFSCATASPRFSQEVAASFAHDSMRRLETPAVIVYYPLEGKAAAERIAARMGECLTSLRSRVKDPAERPKALLFLTSSNFNNAYVTGLYLGEPLHTVLPLHMTSELFHYFNLGVGDVGDIGCHELVHFVQLEQTGGFFHALNTVFGNLLPPNAFTESWFLEGIAQYYEGRLGRATGRPHSAFYRNMFASGVALRKGRLSAGDLNANQRELLPLSGAYLTGLHFVEYLAELYGEGKLWELIDLQGRSVLSPLAVTLRFKAIYGKSVGALFDDFTASLQAKLEVRTRPADQQVVAADVGYVVRIAANPEDGTVARVTAGVDEVARLTVTERGGATRFSHPLARFLPGRPWVSLRPSEVSGMGFSADGRWLYLMHDDTTEVGDDVGQLVELDAHTGALGRTWDGLHGNGGSISPDGRFYTFVEIVGDTGNLVELDLEHRTTRPLTHFTGQETLATPAYSPDGTRIAFARYQADGFDLYVLEQEGKLLRLTDDAAFNYAPKWLDGSQLLFVREHQGHLQAHRYDLATRKIGLVSHAPYIALDPSPAGAGEIVFANREGWGWSLDRAPLQTTEVEPGPALGTSPPPALTVESDRAYSALDHLFVPSLRLPFAYALPLQTSKGIVWDQLYALSLEGRDRLSFHNWAVNALFSLPSRDNAVSFEYGNQLLAPWFSQVRVARSQSGATTDLQGGLSFSRSFWTTPVAIGLEALDRKVVGDPGDPDARVQMIGPGVSFDHLASESTLYGGTQRALGFSGALTYFSQALGSSFDLLDAALGLTLAPRVPLLKRNSLVFSGRARMLAGAPPGLLRVGGIARGTVLASGNRRQGYPGPGVLLPGLAFSEALRGYEDYAVRATEVAIAGARYRYPLIIDHGWASTLYLLPSLFLRQVDLEAFGQVAALDNPGVPLLRSAGGAVAFRTTIGQVASITLYYQLAARFDEHLSPLHLFGFALE